jgi:AsmA protein
VTNSSFSSPYLPQKRRVPLILKILGILVGLVVLTVVVAVFAAESLINSRKDEVLAQVSKQMGRPVTAGKIGFSLLGGQFELNDVVIHRDPSLPDEPEPALSLGLARVNVKLWPIITSGGRKAAVQAITVDKLNVAVVRLPDGELNWQKVAARMATEPEKEKKPLDQETIDLVRNAVIEKIRMDDIAVRFIDLENKGATVAINDLDVALDNVSLNQAFALKVTAGVLSDAKNFDLDAKFAKAPEAAGEIPPPRLEQASISLQPTPLAPLAPFLDALTKKSSGASSGQPVAKQKAKPAPFDLREITEGKLAMKLDVGAGSAIPGGQGPTKLQGFVALDGLKFTGGEKFNARLDSDLVAVAPEGVAETVDIKNFTVKLGEMAIEARGKLSGLAAEAPQVDGFFVQSQGLDFSRLHAFYPAMDKTAGAVLRGPFSINARGSASEGRQRLVSEVNLTPASIEVPGQFSKPAGTALTLTTEVAATPNLIELRRAALNFAKLTLEASGTLRQQGKGKNAQQSFTATANVPPVAVRDLVAIFAPKQLADTPAVNFGAKIEAAGTVGKDETIKVNVPRFSLTGGKSDLTGALTLENPTAPKISFDGRSKYLDVDDFMPPSAKAKEKAGKGKNADATKTGKEPPPPILDKIDGTVKLVVDKGRAAEIDYNALKADLSVKNGRLSARALEVDTFGGHFSGAGTELPLADPEAGFVARGDVSNLDIGAVLGRFAAERNFMTGRLFAKIDLKGAGTLPDELKKTLEGRLGGRVENAELATGNLLAPIAAALERAEATPVLAGSIRTMKDRVNALKDRRLGKLGGAVLFDEGAMSLAKPLEANTPSGPLSLSGKMTLGGEFDMTGTLSLKPELATSLTGGKAKFDAPVPIALRVEGPIGSPRFRPADPVALGRVFVTALARGQGGRLIDEKLKQAGVDTEALQKARAQADAARAQAEQQAAQAKAQAAAEAERARQQAAQRADQARQEAEQRAQKAKEEAERKAKEAGGRALRGILGR